MYAYQLPTLFKLYPAKNIFPITLKKGDRGF